MNESELRDLLQQNDGRDEVELTPSQESRLRAELGLDDPTSHSVSQHAPTEISVADLSGQREEVREPSRRGALPWLSAAAFVLIVGLSLVMVGNRRSASSTLATTHSDDTMQPSVAPEPLSRGQQFCSTAFEELVEAVSAWNGIENWSYLTDRRAPEPDLHAIAHRVQVELHRLGGASEPVPEPVDILGADHDIGSISPELRRSVYEAVLGSINDSVSQVEALDRYSTCDVEALRAASPDLATVSPG